MRELDSCSLADDGLAQCWYCRQPKPFSEFRGRRVVCDGCAAPICHIQLLSEEAQLPTRAHDGDAGYDLYVSRLTRCPPESFTDVPADVAVALAPGYWAQIAGRSSTLRKRGLLVAPAIIDQGYTGPLFAGVWNLNETDVVLEPGERVAQLILAPLVAPQWVETRVLPLTGRGSNGFGSSGL